MDAGTVQLQQLDLFLFFSGAEDNSKRRLFSLLTLIFIQPTQVKLHLSLLFGFEISKLQVNSDQPVQGSMVEKKVKVKIVIIYLDMPLSGNEGESGT
jgi:hypothetical protein